MHHCSRAAVLRRTVPAFVLLFPLALGCAGGTTAGNTLVECRDLSGDARSARPAEWSGTVFTIVMENHSLDDIRGNRQAPYINSLIDRYALAAGYHDAYIHPSKPNYIWMVAGENFGILNDSDPRPESSITSGSHLVNQIEQAGLSWKSYQESMGEACGLKSHGRYAVKHNPFVYFADVNGSDGSVFQPSERCNSHVVDYGELASDLESGSVPDYVFITPDMKNDMHDGSIARGDTWLSNELPRIFASKAYQDGGVLFLLWDEGSGQSDDPPFIVVSERAKRGYVSDAEYDTSSYLKTVQAILALEPLPCDPEPEAVPVMDDLFEIPLPESPLASSPPAQVVQ
jgi:phosphatidylinositol-3-phosphatase